MPRRFTMLGCLICPRKAISVAKLCNSDSGAALMCPVDREGGKGGLNSQRPLKYGSTRRQFLFLIF